MNYLPLELEAYFPNLRRNEYKVTSASTAEYNCIAHAAGKADKWWWPAASTLGAHWPGGVAREETVEAFVLAYSTVGYSTCDPPLNAEMEEGFEKVAIYVDSDGVPTHAARQLSGGTWSSKLGEREDIEHNSLQAIEDSKGLGLGYGTVAIILRRPSKPRSSRG